MFLSTSGTILGTGGDTAWFIIYENGPGIHLQSAGEQFPVLCTDLSLP